MQFTHDISYLELLMATECAGVALAVDDDNESWIDYLARFVNKGK